MLNMLLPSRTQNSSFFFFFFFFFVIVLFCEVSQNVAESCIPLPADATILTQLKNAVLDPLNQLSSWQVSPGSNCTNTASYTSPPAAADIHSNSSCASTSSKGTAWLGVTCGRLHGRVIALNLPSMNLSGPIPSAAIARLKFLRVLNLSSNSFHDSFPAELANCTHLQTLDLSGNYELGGSIPREWARGLSRLQELVLADTGLSGSIPTELANCTELVWLILERNQFSGGIPAELGALSKLQVLNLAISPGLRGRIPASLANCSALIDLSLQVSGLSGSIPTELASLPALKRFMFFQNSLTGEIPTALANCSLLTTIQVGENQLSGNIPPGLGRLKRLISLSLHKNHLTGGIPADLGNCSALEVLTLSINYLSGRMPSDELGVLPLVVLDLFENRLTGGVPSTMIANLTSTLQVLDLSFNQLNGTFQFLNQLQSPTFFYLHVGGNLLSGQIPDVFDRLPGLQALGLNALRAAAPQPLPRSLQSLKSIAYLFLDASNFQGRIPSDLLTNSLQLLQLYLSSNNLSGAIPGSLGALSGLSVLDMSHNSLNGEVPPELGSLFQLQYLNLSNNKLSGQLPTALTACAQLVSLNVSANHLSGPLPPLPTMTALTTLDLSYNNFTGPIPDTLPFNNTSPTVTIMLDGNPGLCGTLVHQECTSAPSTSSATNTHRTTFKIVGIVLGTILLVVMLLLSTSFCFVLIRKRLHSLSASTFDLIKHPIGMHFLNVSATELREATGGFSADHILGMGAVSTVYRAVLSTRKVVAVKVFNNEMALANEIAFKKEVAILAKLRHRNIVRVLGCCFTLYLKAIILELMPNGSLDHHLYITKNGSNLPHQELKGIQKLRILRGVAEGLEYLHYRHPDGAIVHCDLKPHNILLDASFEACIVDFGIAKMVEQVGSESVSHLLRGSIGYIPPEYGYKVDVSTKGDVYSFGVVMLEVFTCKSPTSAEILEDGQTYVSWVRRNYLDGESFSNLNADLYSSTRSQLFRIAMLCTQESPFDRPTMSDVCHMIVNLCHVEETKLHNV